MKGFNISGRDRLHDRIGEVKGGDIDYRISLFNRNNNTDSRSGKYYRIYFSNLRNNSKRGFAHQFPSVGFRTFEGKMVFSGLYVPTGDRKKGVGKLIFEVFSRVQDLLDMFCEETYIINKPDIALFLNKIGFFGYDDGSSVTIIGEDEKGIPIVKQNDKKTICSGKGGARFLVISDEINDGVKTIIGTKYELLDYNLFSKFRENVGISNKIQLYKGRIKRIIF